ncbi:MAG: bifunctional phosphopantothenoylcysteine decarboxylase/phosphopantothenate--cysteine ligase CoaBC [Deltaproteobacteria bacterium]|nr:bifunctional phosphopantothenoylcysteine decarboxylase/phosphopantothenate--cysteine ligase CoaBC [Deltaproteobacteria bacterium]
MDQKNTPYQVLLGVTGGIAAYKACELASALVKEGVQVRVVMTRNATRFVGPLTFAALTGQAPVLDDDLFDPGREAAISHIDLARWAQVVVVAPATANLLAKAAGGLADDLLSTVLLATRAPLILAPAMNPAMWAHPATQENAARLTVRGARLVGPAAGRTACGEEGPGRLAEPAEIAEVVWQELTPHDLSGVRILVSAGPTREHLDPVRYISNPSSGRMGIELARAARQRGALTTLVLGPTHLPAPAGVDTVRVTSAAQMAEAILGRAEQAQVVIKAAAVSDFRPAVCADQKVKKRGQGEENCCLVATTDILASLGRTKGERILVGFAAETEEVLAHAQAKLTAKNLDLLVANDVTAPDAGFGVETNRVHLLHAGGRVESLPVMSKARVAHAILDRVVDLLVAKR